MKSCFALIGVSYVYDSGLTLRTASLLPIFQSFLCQHRRAGAKPRVLEEQPAVSASTAWGRAARYDN